MVPRKKQPFKRDLLLLILVCMLLQGCASMMEAKNGAGIYLKQVAKELKQEFQNIKKIGTADFARRALNYKEGSGLAVEINSFSVSPAEVKRGEAVTINVEYAIAGADDKGIDVNERKDLWYDNREIAQLGSVKFTRENGIWESKTSFKVPDTAQVGKYKIKQSINGDGVNLQTVGFFKVTP